MILHPAGCDSAGMESQSPASNLILFETWLDSIGRVPATGWRWRKMGWIKTLNIAGRVYVSRQEIERFEARAAAGEFRRTHKEPGRKHVPA